MPDKGQNTALRSDTKAPATPVPFSIGCDNAGMELLIVSLASLLAGFVDSIVGGGGLILVPALFAAFPTAHPATLFGTNKGASVWGTAIATWQYSRRVQMRWARPAAGRRRGLCWPRWPAPGWSP